MDEEEYNFYVYAYKREDGTPYYVGKGKGKRAWTNQGRFVSKPRDKNRITLLATNLSEPEAFEWEEDLISLLGRIDLGTGCLHNLTNGGDGSSGYTHKESTKAKIGEALKGKPNPSKRKPVMCLETGVVFESIQLASEWAGVYYTVVSKAANGQIPRAGGYHWQFLG
jgi:hypothetical protein